MIKTNEALVLRNKLGLTTQQMGQVTSGHTGVVAKDMYKRLERTGAISRATLQLMSVLTLLKDDEISKKKGCSKSYQRVIELLLDDDTK